MPGAELPDLTTPRRIHVTNVGGAGMSAVATLLAEMGHRVSGSDPAADTPFLARLRDLGVEVHAGGTRPALPVDLDAVVTSTATPSDDPDVVAATAAGIPVVHRAAALAALAAGRPTVAVAGTHGKTTTSALLATVLAGSGRRPGFVVGAAIAGLGTGAAWGATGAPLVVEADESDGTFLALPAEVGIVTNVEPDHLDRWGDEAALRAGFERFVAGLADAAVLCADDAGAAALVPAARRPVTYGISTSADYRVTEVGAVAGGTRFVLVHGGERVEVVVPSAPGLHNARNAAAALAAAHRLGVGLAEGAAALAGFAGVARRFEHRGEAAGVTFVDDYAHLPTEVEAALAAAAGGSWSRVVCCFQPHRYSRTRALAGAFADSFGHADLLCVTDVYAAGEAPLPGVSGKAVLDGVLDRHPRTAAAWLPDLDDVVDYLGRVLRPGDLCLTLGAGDLTTVPDRLLAVLGERGT
ncbi:MAG: UDP-N-acetylmuramate--L-alanine ligase [Acidimicrobiia bacterium]